MKWVKMCDTQQGLFFCIDLNMIVTVQTDLLELRETICYPTSRYFLQFDDISELSIPTFCSDIYC